MASDMGILNNKHPLETSSFFLGFATSKTGKKGYLVGGLEHDFYEFPYIVNNNPN